MAPGDAEDLDRQLRRMRDDPGLLPTLRAGIGPVKSVAQEIDELEEIYQVLAEKGCLEFEELSGKASSGNGDSLLNNDTKVELGFPGRLVITEEV
jgi:hypothetical protein